jgi:hypothetical protein
VATTIDSAPPAFTNSASATFAFSSTDPNAMAFDCAMDSQTFLSCSSPFTTPALAEGSHTFSVTARDVAGHVGAPQVRSFVVDTTPPVATIDSAPPAFTNSASATFSFSGTDDVSTSDKLGLRCRLSFQAFEPCASPKEYTALPEGQYTLRVRATDEAGNVSATAIYSWTVDLTPPETTIGTGPPNPTNNPATTFTFSSDDPSATFKCNVDAQEFRPCSSPWLSDPVSDGSHIFEVRATDLAGNVDASPATIAFTVDTTPPVKDTPPSSSSPPSPQPSADGPITAPATVTTSFVLIAKRPIRVTRSRLAPITLNCAGSKDCVGVVRLTTARPVRASSARSQEHPSRGRDRRRTIRRVVRLGSAKFVIPARKTGQVKVRLSEKSYRLMKKVGRVKVRVTVRDRDRAGHLRIGTREIFLTVR